MSFVHAIVDMLIGQEGKGEVMARWERASFVFSPQRASRSVQAGEDGGADAGGNGVGTEDEEENDAH